jgi:hypothetical protein
MKASSLTAVFVRERRRAAAPVYALMDHEYRTQLHRRDGQQRCMASGHVGQHCRGHLRRRLDGRSAACVRSGWCVVKHRHQPMHGPFVCCGHPRRRSLPHYHGRAERRGHVHQWLHAGPRRRAHCVVLARGRVDRHRDAAVPAYVSLAWQGALLAGRPSDRGRGWARAELNCSATTLGNAAFSSVAAGSPATVAVGTCLPGFFVSSGAPYAGCDITGAWTAVQNACQGACTRTATGARAEAATDPRAHSPLPSDHLCRCDSGNVRRHRRQCHVAIGGDGG